MACLVSPALILQVGVIDMIIKGNKIGFTVFCLMSIFCMVIIFMFSYQSAEISSGTSLSLYDIFIDVTGFSFISHNAFRKIAHFCEFAALGFSVAGSSYFYFNKTGLLMPLLFSVAYAISDEIHQIFVPDRACRLFDVFVDSCGCLFGIVMLYFFVLIFNKFSKNIIKRR